MADEQESNKMPEREQNKKNEVDELLKLQEKIQGLRRRVTDITDATDDGQNRIISKLGTRVRELETQLQDERERHTETEHILRRTERSIRELTDDMESNKKNKERLQNLVISLEARSDTLQQLAEDAEKSKIESLEKYDIRQLEHRDDKSE